MSFGMPGELEIPVTPDEVTVQQLLTYAQQVEDYINLQAVPSQQKIAMLETAVDGLDELSKVLYFGQEVQLDGIFYEGVAIQSDLFAYGTLSDLPAVRGISKGFLGTC